MKVGILLCGIVAGGLVFGTANAEHPRLLLTAEDVRQNPHWQESALFSASINEARRHLDTVLTATVDIPVPVDAGGGYTHETHKRNAITIHHAGMVYQWTGESKYADLAIAMLLRYAQMYPTLGEHPKKKEQSPGRLFWQSLNESVWLVYAIQGYDAVADRLSAADKETIEERLLRPMARFLSEGQPRTFDRIHNHGAWAAAAVGMTGFVLGDDGYVNKALRGLSEDGNSGFLKQLEVLFSPDGYYTEGPYYQRYALMPFVVFARAIEHNRPDEQIFEYRNGIVLKAIDVAIQLSYAGKFFPLNDAIKDKGLDTIELDHALAIAYGQTGDASLLSLLNDNAPLILTGDGLAFAQAVERGEAKPFPFRSVRLNDGPLGDQGGLAIMRHANAALIFKATSQGLGHGHFDRLNWLYYDNGSEIVSDYGAARFLNVVQKNGGHYLPENTTWAKQSIAHNVLVVDGDSHFGGRLATAEKAAPTLTYFGQSDGVVIASATEPNAYPGISMTRTMAHLALEPIEYPIVVDFLQVESADQHQYDLPVYFQGQIIESKPAISAFTKSLGVAGERNGYEHLWLLGTAHTEPGFPLQLTWILSDRFYTHTSVSDAPRDVLLVRAGAGDPQLSLRPETGFITRVTKESDAHFLSVLEPHGEYNGAREFTVGSQSQVSSLSHDVVDGTNIVSIHTTSGTSISLFLADNSDPTARHEVDHGGETVCWTGPYNVEHKQGELMP